jgi:hypothetical protein
MPLDLDQTSPEMAQTAEVVGLQSNESDREGAMAKADLYKLASYSQKLFQQLNDEDQLEGWVQAKITKAADYIASVYHYLEYEMKFSEYGKALDDSDVLSESQKVALKSKLMEAKSKIKELKLSQAEKAKDKKVDEGALSGGERSCTECGGTGMVYEEPKAIPDHVKGKVEKYKTMVKATKAAHKRMDANKNGIPDDEEMEEGFDEKSKEGDSFKTKTGVATKTSTGVKHTNTSYKDDGEAEEKSGKGVKSHAKAQSAAEKKEKAPAQKQSPKSAKTWGMKDSEKFDNRDGAPAKPKKEKDVGEGVYEAKKKGDGNLANNAKPYDKVTRGDVIAGRLGKDEKGGKTVKEAAKQTGSDKKKCPPMSHIKKMCQDGKSVAEICKMHPDCDQKELKQMVADCKKQTVKEAAKWRDAKHKDKLYTQEPRDYDQYDYGDDDYYNPKPDDYPGEKNLKGGGEFDHNDPLRKGYGRHGTGSMNTHGKRKGMPSRDHIGSLKGSIKSAHGTHPRPNLPEAAAAMWNNIKETQTYIAEKAKAAKDLPGNQEKIDVAEPKGKIDGKDMAALRAKKETVKESTDLSRMRELTGRLNLNENVIVKKSSEVDQLKALTNLFKG